MPDQCQSKGSIVLDGANQKPDINLDYSYETCWLIIYIMITGETWFDVLVTIVAPLWCHALR